MREAMVKVHNASLMFQARANLIAQQARTAALLPLTDIALVAKIVEDTCTEANKPSEAEALGLPKPIGFTASNEQVKKRSDELYASIFSSINRKLLADKEATANALSTTQTADAAIETGKPQDILEEVMDNRMESILQRHGLITTEMTDDGNENEAEASPPTAGDFV